MKEQTKKVLILVLRRWDSPRVKFKETGSTVFLVVCREKKKKKQKQTGSASGAQALGRPDSRQKSESIIRDAGAYGAAVRPQVDTPRQRRQ